MRVFHFLLWICLVMAASGAPAFAAPGGERLLTRLPNGLTVYVIRDGRFPLAVTRLFVRTGSANEDVRQAGISHLLEHMVFKGTDHRPKGKVARDVEALGGYLNAATSFDKTWYMTDMPAAHWRMGMDVVKEMAFQASLDPAELESEKEVVISELERDQDNPRHRLFELLQVSALGNTPYGRPIIGFKETVRAVTADDLRAYVRRWYQPQNMLLLVAGDVPPAEVLAHAQELFGGLANTQDLPAPPAVDTGSAPAGPRVEVVRGPWNKVYLGMAFPAPALSDLRSVELDALAYMLGGDGAAMLPRAYQFETRLVDDIDVSNMSLARAGLLSLTATLDPDKLEAFWQSVTKALAGVRAESFAPEALHRARLNLEDGLDRTAETLNGLAAWLGSVEFDLGGGEAEANLRLTQRNITPAQVQQAIDLWLDPQRARVRVLAPQDAQIPDLEAILEANWPGKPQPAMAEASGNGGRKEMIDLGEGRALILIPDATVPYMAVDFMQTGGNALLAPGRQGLAELTARTLTDGCGKLDAQAMEGFLSDRAASLGARAGLQTFTLSLSGPSRHAADYFSLLGDMIRAPRFDEADVRREANNIKAALRQRPDRPAAFMFARLNPFLYSGGHPYGYDPLGTPELLDAYTSKDVAAFWAAQANLPWVLSVAGDFDREQVLAFARSLPEPQAKAKTVTEPVWGAEKRLDLHLPGRNQAHVLQAFRAVPPTHADAPAFMLLQTLLSGQSGLLFSSMRDEQGLGYVVTAFYRGMPEAGLMAFYIGTTPDKVDQARKGFADVIARLKDTPLAKDVLEAAGNRLLGEYARGRQSLGARAGEAATDAALGHPQDFQKSLIERAVRTSPGQIQAVARKYLTDENLYCVTLLP